MRKFCIALVGGTVLLCGLVLLVLPGPGLPMMAAGLALLATEFFWARRAWREAKGRLARLRRSSGLARWLRRRRLVVVGKSSS